MLLLLLMTSLCGTFEVSMDQLGIYQDTQLSLFKTPVGYLLNSRKEGKAVVFSKDGRVLGRYDRPGHGPGEFHRQYVLKIDEEEILFCSNGRFVVGFDQQLKPLSTYFPPLPGQPYLNAEYGLSWKGDRVLVSLSGSGYLFAELRLKNNKWQLTRELFSTNEGQTTEGPQFLATGKRSLVHHQTAFAAKVGVADQDSGYEIQVYGKFLGDPGSQELTQVLVAEVDDWPLFVGVRALIYGVVRTPNGFVVELFSHLQPGGRYRRWQDIFNQRGDFLKRVPADGKRLLPVINSREVFLIEDRANQWVLKHLH